MVVYCCDDETTAVVRRLNEVELCESIQSRRPGTAKAPLQQVQTCWSNSVYVIMFALWWSIVKKMTNRILFQNGGVPIEKPFPELLEQF